MWAGQPHDSTRARLMASSGHIRPAGHGLRTPAIEYHGNKLQCHSSVINGGFDVCDFPSPRPSTNLPRECQSIQLLSCLIYAISNALFRYVNHIQTLLGTVFRPFLAVFDWRKCFNFSSSVFPAGT